MEEKVKIFKALSDSNRLRILKMLQEKKLCVCEIREVLKLANSTVSQHLNILKSSGFILEEKDGKWVNYFINPKPGDPIVISVLAMLPLWFANDETIDSDKEKVDGVNRILICCK